MFDIIHDQLFEVIHDQLRTSQPQFDNSKTRARLNLSGNKIGADGTGRLHECWLSAPSLKWIEIGDKGALAGVPVQCPALVRHVVVFNTTQENLCVGQWMYKPCSC